MRKAAISFRKLLDSNGNEILYNPSELADDIFEILNHIEYEPNALTPESIKEELVKRKIHLSYPLDSSIEYCKKEGLIDIQDNNGIIILPAGIHKLENLRKRMFNKKQTQIAAKQVNIQEEQKNIGKKQNWLLGISVFIAVISLILAISVGINDWKLKNKQEILINKQLESISPLKPTIEVSVDFPKDRNIAVWHIADIDKYEDGNENFDREKLRFILSNIGRMRSGHINAYLESNNFVARNELIENIIGESSEYLQFEIFSKDCSRDQKEEILKNGSTIRKYVVNPDCDYRVGDFPLGWHRFNLTLKCPFCAEKEEIFFFDFCIYGDDNESIVVCNQEQAA